MFYVMKLLFNYVIVLALGLHMEFSRKRKEKSYKTGTFVVSLVDFINSKSFQMLHCFQNSFFIT